MYNYINTTRTEFLILYLLPTKTERLRPTFLVRPLDQLKTTDVVSIDMKQIYELLLFFIIRMDCGLWTIIAVFLTKKNGLLCSVKSQNIQLREWTIAFSSNLFQFCYFASPLFIWKAFEYMSDYQPKKHFTLLFTESTL